MEVPGKTDPVNGESTSGGAAALRLFGPPACRHADGRVVRLEDKDALVLAWLALEGPTPRARLADLLWPDADSSRSRASLRQRLFRLAKSLGLEAVSGADIATLRLPLEASTDAAILVEGVELDPQTELGGWLRERRESTRQGRITALTSAADAAETARDLDAALAHAAALLELDPLAERTHQRAMRLHYLHGDNASALAAYRRCAALLRDQLGAAPGAETEALRATIERDRAPADAGTAPTRLPLAAQRPPSIVGRDDVLAQLGSAWRSGRAFVVAGDAGMGKSRVLDAFVVGRRAAGERIAFARARPGDEVVPFATAARVQHAIAAAVDASGGTAIAMAAPVGLAPLAHLAGDAASANLDGIVVDDLHFADEASVELFTSLATAEPASPFAWGFARRPAEGTPALDELENALLEAQRREPVTLRPLDAAAMTDLIDSLALPGVDGGSLAEALVRHTGGNPMYALETLRHAWLAGTLAEGRLPRPPTVEALIARRLRQLGSDAIGLARVAAIATPDFDVALAEHVLGMRAIALADAWRELESAQILSGSGFAHDLVHEVVLAGVPAAIAAHVHGAVASWLEARPHEPARVARHWLAAGREREALASLHAAAVVAREASRRKEEASLLERAAAIEEALGETDAAFATLCLLLEARLHLDFAAFDRSLLDRLLELAESDAMRCNAYIAMGRAHSQFGDWVAGRDAARAGLALAIALNDPAAQAELQQKLGAALSMLGDGEGSLNAMIAAEPWMTVQAGPEARTSFHAELAVAFDNTDRHAEAQRFHRLAIGGARSRRRYDELPILHCNFAVSLSCSGLNGAAIDEALTSERLRTMNREEAPFTSTASALLMRLLRDAGRLGEAMRWAELARVELEAVLPTFWPIYLAQESLLWLWLGQTRRAEDVLREARGSTIAADWIEALLRHREARLEQALGRDPGPGFAAALTAFDTDARRAARDTLRLDVASRDATGAGIATAIAVLEESLARGQAGMALAARVRAIQCLHDAGRHDEAAGHARVALQASDDTPTDDLYRGELWWQASRALAAAGARDEADAARRAGVEWIRRVARDELPPAMRQAYLHGNRVNRQLLAAPPEA